MLSFHVGTKVAKISSRHFPWPLHRSAPLNLQFLLLARLNEPQKELFPLSAEAMLSTCMRRGH
jgi:hypothetical protein